MTETNRHQADAAWNAKALVLTMDEDGSMREMGGSRYGAFNHALVDEVVRTAWVTAAPGEKEAADRKVMGMVVAAMEAFEPKDEIEGMLAAQATAMHLASMEAFRRAIIPEQSPETVSKLRPDGTNLARGMTDMLTALAKHRGQGQQKVSSSTSTSPPAVRPSSGPSARAARFHQRGRTSSPWPGAMGQPAWTTPSSSR